MKNLYSPFLNYLHSLSFVFGKGKIFLLLLCVLFSFSVRAANCSGKPTWVYYSNWTNYYVGIQMVHNGKLYQLTTHAANGQYSPTSGTGSLYWTDLGACAHTCTNASISSQPNTSSVSRCQGTAFSALSVSASGSATLSYQWKSSTTSGGSYSNISGAT